MQYEMQSPYVYLTCKSRLRRLDYSPCTNDNVVYTDIEKFILTFLLNPDNLALMLKPTVSRGKVEQKVSVLQADFSKIGNQIEQLIELDITSPSIFAIKTIC